MNKSKTCFAVIILATSLSVVTAPLMAQMPPPADADKVLAGAYQGKSYSPYAGRGFPSRPL